MRRARGGAGRDAAGGGARGKGAGDGGRRATPGPQGTQGRRPPPPPLAVGLAQRGLARQPGAGAPRRDVRARRDRSRGPGRACRVPPPTQVVRRRPYAPLSAVTKQNAPPHHGVPPVPRAPAAIPVPGGQARAAATLPRPPAGLGAADAAVGSAERPGTGHPPLAGLGEPLAAPSQPSLGGRPRGASPPPSPSGGHPHGMLLQLDGHGHSPEVGAVAPELRAPGPGAIGPRPPRGPRLAVRPGGPPLAVLPPPLEGGRADLHGCPPAGAPLGLGPPPDPPSRGNRPAALGRRAPAPGAPGRRVGRRGRGLRGPLGGYHPRRLRPVPLAGRQAPRPARGRARSGSRGAGLHPTGVCRVVRGAASPGPAAAAPTAPPRRERRPRSGVARGPRARGGVAAAPRGAGRVGNALTQARGLWAAPPVRPRKPSLPPPPARRAGHRPPPRAAGLCTPPRPCGDGARRPSPPPSSPPPHPLPRPTRGTAASLPPPPPQPAAAAGGAQHAWPADMQSRPDSHRAPPGSL